MVKGQRTEFAHRTPPSFFTEKPEVLFQGCRDKGSSQMSLSSMAGTGSSGSAQLRQRRRLQASPSIQPRKPSREQDHRQSQVFRPCLGRSDVAPTIGRVAGPASQQKCCSHAPATIYSSTVGMYRGSAIEKVLSQLEIYTCLSLQQSLRRGESQQGKGLYFSSCLKAGEQDKSRETGEGGRSSSNAQGKKVSKTQPDREVVLCPTGVGGRECV